MVYKVVMLAFLKLLSTSSLYRKKFPNIALCGLAIHCDAAYLFLDVNKSFLRKYAGPLSKTTIIHPRRREEVSTVQIFYEYNDKRRAESASTPPDFVSVMQLCLKDANHFMIFILIFITDKNFYVTLFQIRPFPDVSTFIVNKPAYSVNHAMQLTAGKTFPIPARIIPTMIRKTVYGIFITLPHLHLSTKSAHFLNRILKTAVKSVLLVNLEAMNEKAFSKRIFRNQHLSFKRMSFPFSNQNNCSFDLLKYHGSVSYFDLKFS